MVAPWLPWPPGSTTVASDLRSDEPLSCLVDVDTPRDGRVQGPAWGGDGASLRLVGSWWLMTMVGLVIQLGVMAAGNPMLLWLVGG